MTSVCAVYCHIVVNLCVRRVMSYCRLLSTVSLLLLFVISIILFLCSTNSTTTRIVNNTDGRFVSTLKQKKSVSTNKQCTTVSITEDNSLVQSVSCPRLLSGDEAEIRKLRKLQETENLQLQQQQQHDTVEYLKELSVCNNATAARFVHHSLYVPPKELDFPLAFVFLLSFNKSSPESVQHFIRLLKHLYREHNVYCFHISSQTPAIWAQYIEAIASCFPNMLITQDNNGINDDDMFSSYQQCLKTLVVNPELPWKYVINLKGTELPLVTNREMVETLLLLKDSNVITQGTRIEPHVLQTPIPRTNNPHHQFNAAGHAVPYNMTLYTSTMESHSIALSQDFVGMLFRDVRAIKLVKYLHNFNNSFQVYFTTMNHLTDVPGGVEKQKEIKGNKIRFPQVTKQLANSSSECGSLCVLSASDFKWINTKISKNKKTIFFVDKYSSMFGNVVMDCIELQLTKRNMAEYKNDCMLRFLITHIV